MKNLLRKLGFRKADEMELQIYQKSIRNSYAFLLIALLIWTFYNTYTVHARGAAVNFVPSALIFCAFLVQFSSQLLYQKKLEGQEEEPAPKRSGFWGFLFWVILGLGLAASVLLLGMAILR